MISGFSYVSRSLRHYFGAHLLVSLGVAVSTMVLTGALIIGDSVRASLLKTVELRLGKTAYAFTGPDRIFTSALADAVRKEVAVPAAAVMLVDGIASAQGGALRLPNINIWGVDKYFASLSPGDTSDWTLPGPGEVLVSENLASRLQLTVGSSLLLRMDKVRLLPKNAPFVSGEEDQISVRVQVAEVLSEHKLGRFNLRASQTAPFNVFVSLTYLNHLMEQEGRANRLLIADGAGVDAGSIAQVIRQRWDPEDAGLHVAPAASGIDWEITSEQVFMDSVIVDAVRSFAPDYQPILTYFANALRFDGNSTPYSFVSAGPFLQSRSGDPRPGMLINSWLASDLGAGKGDTIRMEYFIIGPLRRLEEKSAEFVVQGVVPLSGVYADPGLMPDIPGLTDAGNCTDWETGIPIDLETIRDKDEAYWDKWQGTPKAFLDYSTGVELWQNRFGQCTAIRLSAGKYDREHIVRSLEAQLPPGKLGFRVEPVLELGLTAAQTGVDFSQLFIGLSFFLLLAGLILLALLLNLHMEKRITQAGTLRAMGYSDGLIIRLFVAEGTLVALTGVLLGALLAILYNKMIFVALQTIWNEIVLTRTLEVDLKPGTLALGTLMSLLLAIGIMWINIQRRLRRRSVELRKDTPPPGRARRWVSISAWALVTGASLLLVYQFVQGDLMNSGIFFTAGGMLLLGSILFASQWILQGRINTASFTLRALTISGIYRNRPRSMRIVILFALGTFVVISTGLNRKDLESKAREMSSGTGGFLFYGETTLPVLQDLNAKKVQVDLGMDTSLHFVQLRKTEGDDASCLNLNRVTRPRILGVQPGDLKGRFSMVKALPMVDPERPWLALEQELPGGLVPAIADQTVILWGLGKQVGDTLAYVDGQGRTMTLKLIAGLANSIFQGNVLIGEEQFIQHFPASSGSHVFLIDGKPNQQEAYQSLLQRIFRNEGLDLTPAGERLAMFNSVENTYLSIFLMLGGLGMILGAVGLGITLARNILDRRKELAMLKSMGYSTRTILSMLAGEHMLLLGLGTLAGAATAVVATLPSIVSDYVQASWQTALLLVLLIVLNGLFWVLIIANRYVRKNLVEALRAE